MPLAMACAMHFNSHAPCGARLRFDGIVHQNAKISTHTPHAGRDRVRLTATPKHCYFNSHAPCGARLHLDGRFRRELCISTHTPHAGRDAVYALWYSFSSISTHTPHAGRDASARVLSDYELSISTHTPHAGRDTRRHSTRRNTTSFQLTRPMRGATILSLL